MGIFEDMGVCGNLDFFFATVGDGEVVPEAEPEATAEGDYSDEEMDVAELLRRMWRAKMLLRRLKEQNKGKEGVDNVKQRQSEEQARRKKMSRSQEKSNNQREQKKEKGHLKKKNKSKIKCFNCGKKGIHQPKKTT